MAAEVKQYKKKTTKKNTNKKNKKENVTVTEVHGMQNLDMKLKLHTTFFFSSSIFFSSIFNACLVTSV